MGAIVELSPVYLAVVHYQRKEYDECIEICTKVLEKNPYDEAVWSLKTRALTAQVKINNLDKLILSDQLKYAEKRRCNDTKFQTLFINIGYRR